MLIFGSTFFREKQFDYREFIFRAKDTMMILELLWIEAMPLVDARRIIQMNGNRILRRDHVEK